MLSSQFRWELIKGKDEVVKLLLLSKEFKKEFEESWARVEYLRSDISNIYIYSDEREIQLSENAGTSPTSVICTVRINNKGVSRCTLEGNFKIGVFTFNFFLVFGFVLLFASLVLLMIDPTLCIITFFLAFLFLLFWFAKHLVLKAILRKLSTVLDGVKEK